MEPFVLLKQQLSSMVPFARHTGVVIDDISAEEATCHLEQRGEVENHIQSMHAGAMFVLGEQASGAAFAGAFMDQMMAVRPVAADAQIKYLKIAKGKLTAKAAVRGDLADLRTELENAGKIVFPVDVSITDEAGVEVSTMEVTWHVSKRR